MRICYVDESGCTGKLPSSTSQVQPAFALLGLVVEHDQLKDITHDFLMMKRRLFPGLVSHGKHLDSILPEIKGSDIRKNATYGKRRRRPSIFFLDKTFELLEKHNACVFGRALVKSIGDTIDGRAVYTSSVQRICKTFSHCLQACGDIGLVIADSRNKQLNARVSHSIFTQKYQSTGDALLRCAPGVSGRCVNSVIAA